MKRCTKCKAVKALEEFYPKRKLGGQARRSECKVCSISRDTAYAAKHVKEQRARSAAHYVANSETLGVRRRERYKSNPTPVSIQGKAYYALHRDAVLARQTAYNKKNSAVRNARWAARKAAQLQATPAWANEDAIAEFYRQAHLMTELSGVKYHVDHQVPLKSKIVSGLHVEFNLQILPAAENIAKGNRTWPDMPEQLQEEKEMT